MINVREVLSIQLFRKLIEITSKIMSFFFIEYFDIIDIKMFQTQRGDLFSPTVEAQRQHLYCAFLFN